MQFSEVKNAKWANAEKTAMDCDVTFNHIGEPIPFTANPNDTTEHGREIFARAVAGDFGTVAEFVQPPEAALKAEL